MFEGLQGMLEEESKGFEYIYGQVCAQLGVLPITYMMSLADQLFIQQNSLLKTYDFHCHTFLYFV